MSRKKAPEKKAVSPKDHKGIKVSLPEKEKIRREQARRKMFVWVDDHGITDRLRRRFLIAYAVHGTISASCKAAGISNSQYYHWKHAAEGEDAREEDKKFLEAFKEAEEVAFDSMEEEARRRAVDGVDEPVYQTGRLVGMKRVYSDTLLMFRMKAKRPQQYRDNAAPQQIQYVDAAGRPAALPSPQINLQQNNILSSPERINEVLELARKFNLMPMLLQDLPAPTADEEIVAVSDKEDLDEVKALH